MAAGAGEIRRREVECLELGETGGAELSEVCQELGYGAGVEQVGFALEGGEGLGVAGLEDDADAWEPVGALAVDEVSEDLGDGPRAWAFVGVGQRLRQAMEEGVQGGGSGGE
jgi:hypothetical protein